MYGIMKRTLMKIGGKHLHRHSVDLFMLVKTLSDNPTVLEIGIGAGRSTKIILMALDGSGMLCSIDLKEYDSTAIDNWVALSGFDLDILADWNEPIDLVFIDLDADSNTEHYNKLLDLLVKHITDDGAIAIYNTNVLGSIIRPAIKKFLVKNKEYVFSNIESKHGFGVLTKNEEIIGVMNEES